MAKAQTDKENAEEKLSSEKVDLNNEESKKAQDGAKHSSQKDQVLYLFGRTGREKEEWFRRFLLASKLKSEAKKPSSKPGIHTYIIWYIIWVVWFSFPPVKLSIKRSKSNRCFHSDSY